MGVRILVADDSITIQKVVELTFSKEDFEIIAVNNGEDAVKKAKEMRPDLLLVDVIMPQKNGYEVCETLRADPSFSGVPILLLAGTFETFDENEGRRVGANDFVTKPFESQMLVSKVKHLLEEAKARPPAPAPMVAAAAPPAAVTEAVVPMKEEVIIPLGKEEELLVIPEEVPSIESATQFLKIEEPPTPLEEEPEFRMAPEVMLEEPSPAPTPAAPKEPEPMFLQEEPLFELKVERTPAAAKKEIAEEKLWELADLGKTEILELPPAAIAPPTPPPPPSAELPPLDLSEFTVGEPTLEKMAAELGLDLKEAAKAEAAPPTAAEEFKLEELIPEAPAQAPSAEAVSIAPAKEEEASPEFVTFETLGEAAAMEMGAEEATAKFEPAKKIEAISIKVPSTPPPFAPVVEEAPPVKAAAPAPGALPSVVPVIPAIKEELVEELVQRVVKELAEKIIKQVVWEVIPDMAEILIIKEIERIKAATQGETKK